MDMSLDEIIKMEKSNTNVNKGKKQRVLNKKEKFSGAAKNSAVKAQRYMDSRSDVRQGAFAKKRSNFQGNQFPVTTTVARKAASATPRGRPYNGGRMTNTNQSSWSIVGRLKWVDARLLRQHEDSDAQIFMIEHATDHSSSCLLLIPDKVLKNYRETGVSVLVFFHSILHEPATYFLCTEGIRIMKFIAPPAQNRASQRGFVGKQQQQQREKIVQQQANGGGGGQRQWPQTLDSRFANMKEERMRMRRFADNRSNVGNNGAGSHQQQRSMVPWVRRATRFPN
ncbi:ribosome maturation factor [Arabidopsis thaliana]|uniref:Ribosome maturation factor n=1 Tax=Arabidopsis thaliana TaxID=3702 RepID=F4JN76_ARATH|nr:ribosome maturation factor [Arabidopsis thaliana]AEE82959.1 ribosome maturation factor [Arabidopsis thaliana]|eukprot:NP_001154220.1 ribosome maturation factor [Arabidopsis thaliana]